MSKKKLDLVGEVCPCALLMTQDELAQMSSGDVLLVETDFNQSVRNIIKWCENEGHEFEVDEEDNGIWLITVTKN
jgi:TusA-related sulfurtransferase